MHRDIVKTEHLSIFREHRESVPCFPISFRIVLRETGALVGFLLLLTPPDSAHSVRIAFAAEEAYRRKGYMSEAVSVLFSLITPYAGNTYFARAIVPETNKAAVAFLEKNGFRREQGGTYERWVLEKPKTVYHILLSCLGMTVGGLFGMLFQKGYLLGMLTGFAAGMLLGIALNRNEQRKRGMPKKEQAAHSR